MKNLILLTVFFCCAVYSVKAQTASGYNYSTATTGSLVLDMNGNTINMASGTTQLINQNSDNSSSALTNIGFTFTFMGTAYTQFLATSNGGIRLGSSGFSSTTYGNSFPVANLPLLAPYLQNIKVSSSGKIHYKLHGTYPERILVIEYLNLSIDNSSSTADATFQVRLYEGSNTIEYVYGNMAVGSVSATATYRVAAIGFSNNTGNDHQFSIDQSTLATSTSGTAITNTNTSTGNITNLNSSANGSRRYFRWVPSIAYKSKFISMSTGSTTWCAGETRTISVKVTNIGTSTWSDASPDVNVGVKWNADADYFTKVDAGNLAPGDTATYTLTVTAPSTAGSNNLTFDIIKKGDCWFANNNGTCGPGNLVYTSSAVTINALPTATISYGSASYCTTSTSATVTRSGTTGGTYSAPAALSMNASGTINLSLSSPGTYTVTYSFTNGTCSNTTITTVSIVAPSSATFSYTSSPYCKNGSNPLPTFSGGGVAGVFSSTTGLVFISSSTGEIDLTNSTAGTYTVTNTIASAGGCAAVTATSSVTIKAATFGYSSSHMCTGGSSVLPTFSNGGTAGTFSASPLGLTLNGSTGQITPSTSASGTYTISNTLNGNGCTTSASTSVTIINTAPTVTIATNYCITPNKVRLTANALPSVATFTYLWSTGETTPYIDVDVAGTYSVVATLSGGCTANASVSVGTELVANGNFELGNTSFTTGYTYSSIVNGLYPEGNYAVNNNANFNHSSFWGTDHTSNGAGTGKFMIVNGAPSLQTVWTQTINGLNIGQTYYLSAWGLSLAGGAVPQLQFAVNGSTVGSLISFTNSSSSLPAGTLYPWSRFYATFIASATSVSLSIVDLQTAAGGNDFGLDDISMSSLAPPGYTTSLSVSGNSTICPGSSLGLLCSVIGGASPYTYTWSGPSSFTSSAQNPFVSGSVTTAMAGNYTVSVLDNIGCTTTGLVTVTIPALPAAPTSVSASASTICLGGTTNLSATSANNNINWYTASTGGTILGTSASAANYTATPSAVGTTTYYAEADTSLGCKSATRSPVAVSVLAQPVSGTLTPSVATGNVCPGGSVSATLTAGSGGGGTVTDVLQYQLDNGSWTNYTSGTSISTTSHTIIKIRTYRTSSLGTCNQSAANTITWNISQPVAGTLTPSIAAGAVCSGTNVSATLTAGTGGTGTVTDVLQYRTNGGSWNNYTSGTAISTTGITSVDIQTYRTATGSNCTTSSTNTVSWTITAAPSATISYSGTPFCSGTGTASVTRTGTAGGSYSASPSGLSIDATTGQINLAASTYGAYTITYTIAAASPCSVFTTTTSVVVNTYTWTGATNTDWNTASNWAANIVPTTSCPTVYIPNTVNKPILSSGVAAINNLSVGSGATVTITNATLKLTGTITSSNAIDASKGTIILNGTSAQTIDGTMFANKRISTLLVGNSAGVTVTTGDSLLITSAIGFDNVSNAVLTTNDKITLLSRDTSTARIAAVADGNSISGKITVERYIPNHAKAWQFVCAPTIGQTIKNAWQEGTVTPNGNPNPGYGTMLIGGTSTGVANGFDVGIANNGSIKTYNQSTGLYDFTSSAYNMVGNNKGFMLFVRGDRSVTTSTAPATTTILRSTGTVYQPNNPPASVNVAAGKYESVANPYASAIDFSQLNRTGGIANLFYTWDPKLAGDYGYGGWQTLVSNAPSAGFTVTPGGGSYAGANTNIESGQTFLIYAPFSSGMLSFSESCKTSGSNIMTRSGGLADQIKLNLKVIRSYGPELLDGVLSQYDLSYDNNIDNMDAPKLNPSAEAVSIFSTNKTLSVERRTALNTEDTIQYRFGQLRTQSYQLEVIGQDMGAPGLTAFMEDTYLHQQTPVDLDGTTVIPFTVTSDAASAAALRFRLVFKQATVLPVSFVSVSARRLNASSAKIKWFVENETSINKYIVEKSFDGTSFTEMSVVSPTANNGGHADYSADDVQANIPNIYYRIKAISINGRSQYSVIVKIGGAELNEQIRVFPNPVTDKKVNITLPDAGTYTIQLVNKAGQVLMKTILISSGRTTHTLNLPLSVAKGSYILKIDGNKENTSNLNIEIL